MKHAKVRQVERPKPIEAEVQRTRAFGDYGRTARERSFPT